MSWHGNAALVFLVTSKHLSLENKYKATNLVQINLSGAPGKLANFSSGLHDVDPRGRMEKVGGRICKSVVQAVTCKMT
jgi:hypothetical protein